ncbi:MAG TPA: hypothetical protein VJX72_07560 [Candidatus Acidoferrum sp.]|nr:hypothetical protein [Candidatus Acidoferrum sp.]
MQKRYLMQILFSAVFLALAALPTFADDDGSVLKKFKNISTVASTVPANGDVNPYGIVRVERSIGHLYKDHILVSNFNNAPTGAAPGGLQGTGTTIVDIAPDGTLSLFAQIDAGSLPGPCPGGVGLTTALAVFRSGWVIVGSLPTSDGMSDTAQPGCLLVLDSYGHVAETFSGTPIDGPWDMTWLEAGDDAVLFVTNVLNGTVAGGGSNVDQGTVVRINLELSEHHMPSIESITVIGSGFPEHSDPAALVVGPTGVALSPNSDGDHDSLSCKGFDHDDRVLYVADTVNNRVAAIHHALCRKNSDGTGDTLSVGGFLNGPLGLTVTPEDHILTVNAGDGFVTEITPWGHQIGHTLLDSSGMPQGAGALFGLIFVPNLGIYYVDDAANTLNLLR